MPLCRGQPRTEEGDEAVTPELQAIFDRCVDTGTWFSSELLAEILHPDPDGDFPDVRRAFQAHIEALSEFTSALQIMPR